MTTTTETKETTKKKGAKPTHEIFPVGADGKPNYSGRIAAWSHKTGGGMNFSIGTIDNYLHDPPAGFKKNSFQATMGLTYSLR